MDNKLNYVFSRHFFPLLRTGICPRVHVNTTSFYFMFHYVSNVMCSPNNVRTLENSHWLYCSPAKHPSCTCSTLQSSFISLHHCCNVLLLTLFVIKYYVFSLSSYILNFSPTALLPLSPDTTVLEVMSNQGFSRSKAFVCCFCSQKI